MCLIVDNNIVHRVLLRSDDPDYAPVSRALFRGSYSGIVKLVYGGRLLEEYHANTNVRKILVELDRTGRAKKIPDAEVSREANLVSATGLCVSDDPHIIGLAKASGARILCSDDQRLQQDFTNGQLLSKPRGKIFRHPKHARLFPFHCTPEH